MQWHGGTNKSSTKLNAAEIKFDSVICLRMEKTTKAKSHQVILRSPLSRTHYYQSQAVTSIRNLTKPFGLSRNTNLQLNPYPNT